MSVPRGAAQNGRTRVLLAVLSGHSLYGSIMAATGFESKDTVRKHLLGLERDGLIEWARGRRGTIHATVQVVACDPSMMQPRAGARLDNDSPAPGSTNPRRVT